MFRQYFDKLSMTLLNMTETCQPELVEGGIKYWVYGLTVQHLNLKSSISTIF